MRPGSQYVVFSVTCASQARNLRSSRLTLADNRGGLRRGQQTLKLIETSLVSKNEHCVARFQHSISPWNDEVIIPAYQNNQCVPGKSGLDDLFASYSGVWRYLYIHHLAPQSLGRLKLEGVLTFLNGWGFQLEPSRQKRYRSSFVFHSLILCDW